MEKIVLGIVAGVTKVAFSTIVRRQVLKTLSMTRLGGEFAMMVLRIPHPFLKTRAHLVEPDTAGLQPFIDDMVETLYRHPRCVGLAATQFGKPWRLIVMDASRLEKEGTGTAGLFCSIPGLSSGKANAY